MEILFYIWIACIIINVLYCYMIDDVLFKYILESTDNNRLKDNPSYARKCYIVAMIIMCISGPIGTLFVVLR